MNKTLVLVPDCTKYFFPYVKTEAIDVFSVCRTMNTIETNFMRIVRYLNISYSYFYGEWKNQLQEYRKVILFDMSFTPALAKYIIKHSNAQVYVYLWNPIKTNYRMLRYVNQAKEFVKVFSYDKDDCEKYGMSFAPMTYTSDLPVQNIENIADLAFLGYAKDRLPQISCFYKQLSEIGLKCNFYVVGKKVSTKEKFTISETVLSYNEYLKMIFSSNAILDFVQSGQSGMSLRVLESLFLKRKLVTNNERVMEYDFYCPENIYVLNDANLAGLKDFFSLPWKDIDEDIIQKYDFSNWIDYYFVDE